MTPCNANTMTAHSCFMAYLIHLSIVSYKLKIGFWTTEAKNISFNGKRTDTEKKQVKQILAPKIAIFHSLNGYLCSSLFPGLFLQLLLLANLFFSSKIYSHMRFWEKESYYSTLFFGFTVQPAYFWKSQNQYYAIAAENYHEYSSVRWIIPFFVKKIW